MKKTATIRPVRPVPRLTGKLAGQLALLGAGALLTWAAQEWLYHFVLVTESYIRVGFW